jgi:hypothetical protein
MINFYTADQILDYSLFFEIAIMIFAVLMMIYPGRHYFAIAQNDFPHNTLVFALVGLASFFLLAVFKLKIKAIINNWSRSIIKAIKVSLSFNKNKKFIKN